MSESKHSPAPWRLYGDIGNMVGADNMHSADCQSAHDPQANAAHIVKCVNAYPVMLETLKRVHELMRDALVHNHTTYAISALKLAIQTVEGKETK